MSVRTIIAIDPGSSGAVAVWQDGEEVATHKMPETRGDAIFLLKTLFVPKESVAYIEKIAGFIPDGGASQMFEFGKSVERCGAILETLGCPIIEIPPQSWQKLMGMGKSERRQIPKELQGKKLTAAQKEEKKVIVSLNGKAKRAWKSKLREEAQRRYPHLKVTLDNGDALLILAVAQQLESQKIGNQ